MRIAVWHNLPSGGGNRALHDQVRGLVGRGHHVEIWCPPTANRTFLPLGDIVEEHVVPIDGKLAPFRNPLKNKLYAYLHVLHDLGAMDRHCRACAGEINRGGFDVLLAHASSYFHPTPIGRHVDAPSALYLQEPNRALYEAMPRLMWLAYPPRSGESRVAYCRDYFRDLVGVHANRVLAREELASARDFDAILVNSYFSRESIRRAYGLDSQVCYLGVDADLFRPSGASKEGFVVGLGNIDENKGVHVAVEALGTIEASDRPELAWIGNFAAPAYLQKVEGRAKELGVRFRHMVNVTNADLVDTLGRATLMVYTSRLEPFGYAPLEANACGTAVVAVAEGGVRETVRDGINGTLVGDGEPHALGRAIRDYCTDPEKARAAGLAARRNVEENWTLAASIDRLEAKLSALLRDGQGVAAPMPLEAQTR